MRLKTLISGLVLMTVLSSFAAGSLADEPASFKDALATAKAQNKLLVIDFYTDW